MPDTRLLEDRFAGTGVKLERVNGITVWEAHPVLLHQEAVDRIRATLKATAHDAGSCGCFHYADLSLRFPDGSEKRPDISLFCQRPVQNQEAVTTLPEAVIEIISLGYEAKDYEIGLPFYMNQGVKDVVLFNPHTNEVLHCWPDGTRKSHQSPVELVFMCGCAVTV